jgi:hypothetical protein
MSQYATKKNESIDKIIHDEQYNFKEDLDKVYCFCLLLAKNNATLNLGNIETINYKALPFDSNSFEFKESSHCYGIQTVDVCLYTLSHIEQYKSYKNILQLFQFINEKCERYETTTETIRREGNMHQLIKFLS